MYAFLNKNKQKTTFTFLLVVTYINIFGCKLHKKYYKKIAKCCMNRDDDDSKLNMNIFVTKIKMLL